MEAKYVLGIDIGTYESKGVIADRNGRVILSMSKPHTMIIPRQGWAEHDAEKDWWGDFCYLSNALLQESGIDKNEIGGVGCSAIGPCMLPIDREGNPLRNAVLYGVDTRATKEIQELEMKFGKKRLFADTGNDLSSQAVGPKILWLKYNEPEIYQKTYKIVTASTFLTGRLTGRYVIDHLTASFYNPLYDYRDHSWNPMYCVEIISSTKLPTLAWGPDLVGTVTAQAASQTGLAEGTPVVAGTVDAAAEAVSVGVVRPGQMMLMYGSTIFMYIVRDTPLIDQRLWNCQYVFDGTTALAAGTATSGSLTRWLRDQMAVDLVTEEAQGGENAYTVLAKQAEAIHAGCDGLINLPFFSGERTPINDPKARGTFFGLTLSHTRAHLFRSILEGVGFGIKQHIDILREHKAEPEAMVAVGGGTKNPLWLQIVSNICQLPQLVPEVTIGASYGDCFLAALGTGMVADYRAIEDWVQYKTRVEPDTRKAEVYLPYYQVYKQLYERNADLMHRLHELGS